MKDYLHAFLATPEEKILGSPQVPHRQNRQKGVAEAFDGFDGTPPVGTQKFFSHTARSQKSQEPTSHPPSNPSQATTPDPLTQYYPCVVCRKTERWDDHGIWRCLACWPEPVTQSARLAAAHDQAPLAAQHQAQRTSESRPKPRDPRLGPILPPCATCGELRHWHNHQTGTYDCWTCTPPPMLERSV